MSKLCKDCKWSATDWLGDRFMECRAPENIKRVGAKPITALINGTMLYDDAATSYRYTYCTTHRDDMLPWIGHTCGRWGRWFDAREPQGESNVG